MAELSPDVVRLAYRLFLNREAESDSVVLDKVNAFRTYRDLRENFVECAEFQDQFRRTASAIESAYWSAPAPVEIDVSREILERLWRRVSDQWLSLGAHDPYWSVLTHDDFRIGSVDEGSLAALYETGRQSADLIRLFEKKSGATAPRGTCFELGCGVGRITAHLAEQFDHIIAADISQGNLELCQAHLHRTGIKNVQTMLLTSPDDILAVVPFDFFYSVIVLQHNPPPIQKVLLENMLRRLSPGGACLFQTPSCMANYQFSSASHLACEQQIMDLHCLPTPVVLQLLCAHGLQIRNIEADPWVGAFGSYSYFATRTNLANQC